METMPHAGMALALNPGLRYLMKLIESARATSVATLSMISAGRWPRVGLRGASMGDEEIPSPITAPAQPGPSGGSSISLRTFNIFFRLGTA